MSTGATIALVGGLGLAMFLVLRAQQQGGMMGPGGAPPPGAAPAGGGGIQGLIGRGINQWIQDPLGIANQKQAFNQTVDVVKNAGSSLYGLGTDIVGGIRSWF